MKPMKKFLLVILTVFFAYYCAYITSGASEKQSIFGTGSFPFFYKLKCAITGETDTTNVYELLARGETYLIDQNFELALKDAKKVILMDSTLERAKIILSKAFLGLGDTTNALSALQNMLLTSYYPAEPYALIGTIYSKKGFRDTAVFFLKKAIESDQAFVDAHYEIARIYFNDDSLNLAIEHLNLAIANNEYHIESRNLRRKVYIKTGNLSMAEIDYQFIASNSPDFFANYSEKAESAFGANNYQGAIEYYKLALDEQPGNRELLEAKARAYINLQKFDSALLDYQNVLALQPDYLSYFNVAYTYGLLNNGKEAVNFYTKSIALNDQYVYTFNNRGYENYRLKNYSRAEDDYTRAIQVKPDYYLPYYNRGLLYYEQKKYQLAIEDYKTTLNYIDDKKNVYYSLALAYEDIDSKSEAIANYNLFLSLADESDSLRTAYINGRLAVLNNN
jgi:tetratricopeptide (TPR) repeat protein